MGTTFESTTKSRTNHRHQTSWPALGVIAVAILAVGASLVYIQTPLEEPSLVVLPANKPAAATTSNKATALPVAPAPTTRRRAER